MLTFMKTLTGGCSCAHSCVNEVNSRSSRQNMNERDVAEAYLAEMESEVAKWRRQGMGREDRE